MHLTLLTPRYVIKYLNFLAYTYNYDTTAEHNSEEAAGDVLKKHLCWSFFFIKLQAFRPATLLKRDPYTDVFL